MDSSSGAVALSQISQISVPVRDLERAIGFYRDALGMKHLFTVPGMSFFDCGGIRLMLSVPETAELDHPSSIIYFNVADIRSAHAVLGSRGVKFENEPHVVARMPDYELWMSHFRDSEDNLLSIMSEAPRGRTAQAGT